MDAIGRERLRQERARPIADALHKWLIAHRLKVPDGSATANAMDYSLKRRSAPSRYIDDGNLLIDTNWMENRTGYSPARCALANERLPTQPANCVKDLLPHRWLPRRRLAA